MRIRTLFKLFGGLFFLLLNLFASAQAFPVRYHTETIASPTRGYDETPARPDCSSSQEMEVLN